MQIIDAQVHIWGSGKPSDHHRQTSIYTAEELIKEMDAAGVNGARSCPMLRRARRCSRRS